MKGSEARDARAQVNNMYSTIGWRVVTLTQVDSACWRLVATDLLASWLTTTAISRNAQTEAARFLRLSVVGRVNLRSTAPLEMVCILLPRLRTQKWRQSISTSAAPVRDLWEVGEATLVMGPADGGANLVVAKSIQMWEPSNQATWSVSHLLHRCQATGQPWDGPAGTERC